MLFYVFIALAVFFPELSDYICTLSGIAQPEICRGISYGMLIGVLCSSMLVEGVWMYWWERKNQRALYFE